MKNPDKVLPQLMVAVVGSWGYFCMGAVRGWSSPGIPSLNKTLHHQAASECLLNNNCNDSSRSSSMDLTEADFKWISSVPMLGALVGALVVSIPMQYFGRKAALVGHYTLFTTGFLLIGFAFFAHGHQHKSIMIYVGRCLTGFAAGCTTPASQIYLSECSSPRIRGRLGSLTASSLALGILVTYIIGAFVEWYVLAWVFGVLPVVFLTWTLFMPETPVWLVSHGREDQARLSLQRLRGKKTDINVELNRIKENNNRIAVADRLQEEENEVGGNNRNTNSAELLSGRVLKPLGISLAIMFFQQSTGVNAVVFHTVNIFHIAGSELDGRYCTIIVGFVQLVFTVASGFFVDYYGRRVLLMSSSALTSVSLAAMGTFFYFQRVWGEEKATADLGWLPLLSLIVFFVAYSVGLSNVPFIVMGEMFPSQFRAVLGTISSSFNLLCTFVVVRCFPDLLSSLGKDGTFYLFTACTLLSIVFVYFFLPETKGKTLEEMEQLFSQQQQQHHVVISSSLSSTISRVDEGSTVRTEAGVQQLPPSSPYRSSNSRPVLVAFQNLIFSK